MSSDSHGAEEGPTSSPEDAHSHSHGDAVYKGLVALGGIYFFFLVERIMRMYSERNKKISKMKVCNGAISRKEKYWRKEKNWFAFSNSPSLDHHFIVYLFFARYTVWGRSIYIKQAKSPFQC